MRRSPAAVIAACIFPSARSRSAGVRALIVSRTCASPVPRPASQPRGSLAATSPSRAARLAMPSANSAGKLPRTSAGTPSAVSPAAVSATFNVVAGLPSVHGSAVVT